MTKVVLRADRARERLEVLGITQDALGVSLDIGLRTVQRWFAGQRVQLDVAERVAMLLGLGTSELFVDVPQAGLIEKLASMRLVGRLIRTRDGAFAQLAMLVHQHGAHLLESIFLRPHPSRGFVRRFSLASIRRHRFVCLRVLPSASSGVLQVFARMTRGTLLERAWCAFQDEGVWLAETVNVRSMRASCAPGNGFALWCWVGEETEELVLASTVDFRLVHEPVSEATSRVLDMTSHEDAVCVRPLFGQLLAAKLPMGCGRVAPRDAERIDIPIPSHVVARRERLWKERRT